MPSFVHRINGTNYIMILIFCHNGRSASGYSEYRPVASNDTEEGKSGNRGIDIDLVPLELNKAAMEGTQK